MLSTEKEKGLYIDPSFNPPQFRFTDYKDLFVSLKSFVKTFETRKSTNRVVGDKVNGIQDHPDIMCLVA